MNQLWQEQEARARWKEEQMRLKEAERQNQAQPQTQANKASSAMGGPSASSSSSSQNGVASNQQLTILIPDDLDDTDSLRAVADIEKQRSTRTSQDKANAANTNQAVNNTSPPTAAEVKQAGNMQRQLAKEAAIQNNNRRKSITAAGASNNTPNNFLDIAPREHQSSVVPPSPHNSLFQSHLQHHKAVSIPASPAAVKANPNDKMNGNDSSSSSSTAAGATNTNGAAVDAGFHPILEQVHSLEVAGSSPHRDEQELIQMKKEKRRNSTTTNKASSTSPHGGWMANTSSKPNSAKANSRKVADSSFADSSSNDQYAIQMDGKTNEKDSILEEDDDIDNHPDWQLVSNPCPNIECSRVLEIVDTGVPQLYHCPFCQQPFVM